MTRNQAWITENVAYGTYGWLRREVALKIGHKPDARLLGNVERSHVDSMIESGLQQFITAAWPAPQRDKEDEDEDQSHRRRAPIRWSFLEAYTTVAMVPGTSEYALPANFGARLGEPTTSREAGKISIVEEEHIRQLIQSENKSGPPRYCAIKKSSIGGATKQSTTLVVYPVPEAAENITIGYTVDTVTLDDANIYPPGGLEHAETLLAYCFLAIAQRSGKGLQEANAHLEDRLQASVAIDRQSGKATADGVWVDDDGEFGVAYLSRYIGLHIGAGPNPAAWSDANQKMIAEAIRRARRRVFNPPLIRDEKYPHEWSFLRPIGILQCVPGQWEYLLPEDFVDLYSSMTHSTDGSTLFPAVKMVFEQEIRQLIQREETSARPERCAIRPRQFSDREGTRYELLLWPVPDQNYELTYRYRMNPDTKGPIELPAMVNDFKLHGADRFSEVYLEAAMLVADELMGKKRSVHENRFLRAVESAIGQDRLTHSPSHGGYNHDPRSNAHDHKFDIHDWDENLVTYNGRVYT